MAKKPSFRQDSAKRMAARAAGIGKTNNQTEQHNRVARNLTKVAGSPGHNAASMGHLQSAQQHLATGKLDQAKASIHSAEAARTKSGGGGSGSEPRDYHGRWT